MATKTVRFRINNKGIGKAATGPESRAAVFDMATKMMAHAVSISPHESGDYAGSFGIHAHIRRDWPVRRPNPRACADVFNDDPGALAIEKGTARTRPDGTVVTTHGFRVLTRTLQHFEIPAAP
ncbi:hypothetical protein I0C86_41470 [Plantactinospora sp. S1510]|uniref:Uncharacterized protein n=1 Tax=Plantactinospora alkalitolerans TaxID=2789879 RepID=A0ABS0HAU2_9ACTN|nr:hypothetical protein [Plantactinospora alkalitolerans]MBF9135323.1 hypothetical protein [Plantactinospora alkalitolerans]